jgi:hypothetical protein
MALTKKPHMSEKRLAALGRNRALSHGPATPEGRERIRAAHLRHGSYSKSDEEALRALGEDPADFRKLLDGLRGEQTADILHEHLAKRLARALWRMERADHMQDGCALRQAREEEYAREGRLHMQMMRLKITARHWQLLAQAVARPHYVTTRDELNFMRQLHKDGAAKEMSEVCLALFYQLQEPGKLKPGDPGFEDEEQQDAQGRVLMRIKDIFGLNHDPEPPAQAATAPGAPPENQQETGALEGREPNPYPEITEAQWAARQPVRQLLENLLTRQVEIFDAQHHDLMRQVLNGPSVYERAAEIVPKHPDAALLQRMEDSNCRQLMRMSSLLLRLRRQEHLRENRERLGKSVDV